LKVVAKRFDKAYYKFVLGRTTASGIKLAPSGFIASDFY
jgi:hypothetical protein